jgi:hypothetical protein
MIEAKKEFVVTELFINTPKEVSKNELKCGEVGHIVASIKDISSVKVGDTITSLEKYTDTPLEGYKPMKSMVFCGLYPTVASDYDLLRDAIEEIEIQHNNSVNWRDEISLTLKTFNTTNKSKKRIVEQLITLFEQNNIIIPDDTKLLTQLSMFEAKVNNLGTVQYAGANGSHDDLVMSLCILISALWNIVE